MSEGSTTDERARTRKRRRPRLTFYFHLGSLADNEQHTGLVLTLDPEEALNLGLRLIRAAQGTDIVQIDLRGGGEWIDSAQGMSGTTIRPARLRRCDGSGLPLVRDPDAPDHSDPTMFAVCPACGDDADAPGRLLRVGDPTPEHKRASHS